MDLRVAIQGVAGCFHDAAAREYFEGQDIETVPCETFNEMFNLIKSDASMLGIWLLKTLLQAVCFKTTNCCARAI